MTISARDRGPGDFSRRVAHALRSPLGVIVGALDTPPEENPELHTRLAALGRRSTAQLQRLSNRLALLAALDAQSEALRVSCEVVALAPKAVATIAATRVRRGVSVGTEFPDHVAPVVGDPGLIEAAYSELVDNAVRFANTTVTVDLRDREQSVTFGVRHDGGPITTEVFTAALDRNASLGDRSGLGIGLWIANAIAEQHGGKVAMGHDGRMLLTLPRDR